MDPRRIRLGEALAGLGGLAVLVGLTLDWARLDLGAVRPGLGVSASAYAPLADATTKSGFGGAGIVFVLLLLLVAGLALALVALTASAQPVAAPLASGVLLVGVGLVTTVALALRLAFFQPDLGFGLPDSAVELRIGAYVALAGVVLASAGGWLALRDERTGAPYNAAPVLEPRPAPPVA